MRNHSLHIFGFGISATASTAFVAVLTFKPEGFDATPMLEEA